MKAITLELGALMGRSQGDDDERPNKRPIIEAQVERLKEFHEIFAAGCTHKPGDLITPRDGSPYVGRGLPHIVLEVKDKPHFAVEGVDQSSPFYGARLDVRVATFVSDGSILTYWMESHWLEPWTADMAASNAG